jgi:precorrin-6B methylase 2
MKRIYQAHSPFDITHDVMMSKAFLSFPLNPKVIWDVGVGPGKFLIESKFRYKDVTLIGIENNARYPELMRANMERHGLQPDDIQIVERDACYDEFEDLPRPDAIYMSCAGQAEVDILPKFWEYLAPGGMIVCAMSPRPEWTCRIDNAVKQFGGVVSDLTCFYDKNQIWQPAYIKAELVHWHGTKPAE